MHWNVSSLYKTIVEVFEYWCGKGSKIYIAGQKNKTKQKKTSSILQISTYGVIPFI